MDSDAKNSPEIGDTKLPLAMTRQQAEVFELLRGLSTKEKHYHKWYQGVIEIITSQSPDRIAQAAHSLRELCDELPSAIAGIPKFVSPISAAKPLGQHFLDILSIPEITEPPVQKIFPLNPNRAVPVPDRAIIVAISR